MCFFLVFAFNSIFSLVYPLSFTHLPTLHFRIVLSLFLYYFPPPPSHTTTCLLPFQLDEAISKTVTAINSASPAAVRAAKRLVSDVTGKALTVDKPETKQFLASAIASIRVSKEGQAGLQAFLSKQKAPWTLTKA